MRNSVEWKRLVLASAGVAALAGFAVSGVLTVQSQAQAPTPQASLAAARPSFEVASVKPDKSGGPAVRTNLGQPGGYVTATYASLRYLIANAYHLVPAQAIGTVSSTQYLISGPTSIDSEHFDIEASADGSPTVEQKRLMLQSLLADRFKLVVHHETRQLPVFELTLAKAGKTGPQLLSHTDGTKCIEQAAAEPSVSPSTPTPRCGVLILFFRCPPECHGGSFLAMVADTTMEGLAAQLNGLVDRPVLDRTRLNGAFDVTLEYTPDVGQMSPPQTDASAPDPSAPPSIFTAIQQQLGLKLVPQTGPVDVLVIDHIEEPSPN